MTSGYLAPLRHRDFALLWSGQTVSMLGDGGFTVTLALETLRVDPHPIGLSYVLAARLLPAVVFVLLGGAIADRVPRRLAMLGSDLARGQPRCCVARTRPGKPRQPNGSRERVWITRLG